MDGQKNNSPAVMGALGTIKKNMENYTNNNINIHELLIERNCSFYSPPSQAGPLYQIETLIASQSPWFGLGC